ncbi:MAG: malonyl-CoA decarboxylase [Rhodocyclaceae bacterium]|nr:MAG: malonyl-CoA decarboxylase [Rhodocyclaceae bacterium]TND05622.1 MAG: malonyl-CoA decarboxylase [Rhodocyclaceae bacterium]
MVEGLVQRLRSIVGAGGTASVGPKQLGEWRRLLTECAEARGGEVSARIRAAALAQTYLELDDSGRHAFLRLISLEFGPEPGRVAKAHEAYQRSIGTEGQWDAEAELRAALRSARLRILTQFNAIPQGVKFLVDLRADLLRYLDEDTELAPLDRELESRLAAWFDVGFLELQRITWNSSAALLEKLIQYEAVHEIRSWTDLKNRLDSDRRLYAFFHPRMPMEPLIFVEVALTDHLADSVQALLDEHAPVFDSRRADTAIFYSISNTQAGLRGVSFGSFLLKRVIDDLQRDFPKLRHFATLSPLPGFGAWVRKNPQDVVDVGLELDAGQLAAGDWAQKAATARKVNDALSRLAARYLTLAKASRGDGRQPLDAVARFHLGNGARIERINPLGDASSKGMQQSFGVMVNYLYDPDSLEDNVESFAREGAIATSAAIRRQARQK